jgi:hypothetical protein
VRRNQSFPAPWSSAGISPQNRLKPAASRLARTRKETRFTTNRFQGHGAFFETAWATQRVSNVAPVCTTPTGPPRPPCQGFVCGCRRPWPPSPGRPIQARAGAGQGICPPRPQPHSCNSAVAALTPRLGVIRRYTGLRLVLFRVCASRVNVIPKKPRKNSAACIGMVNAIGYSSICARPGRQPINHRAAAFGLYDMRRSSANASRFEASRVLLRGATLLFLRGLGRYPFDKELK